MTAPSRYQIEAEAFADLVLDDDELMRAEFDALIAACWESPSEPPRRKPSPPSGGHSGRPPHPRPPRRRLTSNGGAPAGRPQSRQRGPPSPPAQTR